MSRESNRRYYARHAEQEKDRVAKQRAEGRAFIDALKTGPCKDCGRAYPPECMDFDHMPGVEKLAGVSRLLTFAKERILAEVAKCELVCANCHRIRTKQRNHEGMSRGFTIRRTN